MNVNDQHKFPLIFFTSIKLLFWFHKRYHFHECIKVCSIPHVYPTNSHLEMNQPCSQFPAKLARSRRLNAGGPSMIIGYDTVYGLHIPAKMVDALSQVTKMVLQSRALNKPKLLLKWLENMVNKNIGSTHAQTRCDKWKFMSRSWVINCTYKLC